MKLYKIRNWNLLFENNRSRELKNLSKCVMPNKHDGATFSELISLPDGPAMFGAWALVVQIASKCHPRGTLLRDDRTPMTAAVLSLKTRAPEVLFQKTLDWLEEKSDWLEVTVINSDISSEITKIPHHPAVIPQVDATLPHDVTNKQSKTKQNKTKKREAAESLLELLNLITGKSFRPVESNLKPIEDRLSEPGVTEDGVSSMISRQCEMWGTDPKMSEYLRPETLFRKGKFDSYYASKDLPTPTNQNENSRNSAMGITNQQASERGRKTAELVRRKMERRKLEAQNGTLFKTP